MEKESKEPASFRSLLAYLCTPRTSYMRVDGVWQKRQEPRTLFNTELGWSEIKNVKYENQILYLTVAKEDKTEKTYTFDLMGLGWVYHTYGNYILTYEEFGTTTEFHIS